MVTAETVTFDGILDPEFRVQQAGGPHPTGLIAGIRFSRDISKPADLRWGFVSDYIPRSGTFFGFFLFGKPTEMFFKTHARPVILATVTFDFSHL